MIIQDLTQINKS